MLGHRVLGSKFESWVGIWIWSSLLTTSMVDNAKYLWWRKIILLTLRTATLWKITITTNSGFPENFPLKIFVQMKVYSISCCFKVTCIYNSSQFTMLSDFHFLYAFYDCALVTEPTFSSSPFYYYEVISHPHCRVILVQHWPLAAPCSKCILHAHRFSAYLGFLY